VDPTRLELVTSAMRGRLDAFVVVRNRSENRLDKPGFEACVSSCSPTFALVTVRVTVKRPRAASTMTSVSLLGYQTRRIMFGNPSYLGE